MTFATSVQCCYPAKLPSIWAICLSVGWAAIQASACFCSRLRGTEARAAFMKEYLFPNSTLYTYQSGFKLGLTLLETVANIHARSDLSVRLPWNHCVMCWDMCSGDAALQCSIIHHPVIGFCQKSSSCTNERKWLKSNLVLKQKFKVTVQEGWCWCLYDSSSLSITSVAADVIHR